MLNLRRGTILHKSFSLLPNLHLNNVVNNSNKPNSTYLSSINPELIDVVLMEWLLKKICTDSEEGAILVFLPGWDDINQTTEKLLAFPYFADTSKFIIFSLHSMIPSAEQKKVFKRPPAGVQKIILSTNIAETTITIDGIISVIDSGRMKEKSYDPYNNVSTLHSSWVSMASAKQREGRAGRCQPGTCYHLYSKFRAASFLEYQVPEIRRMPIEELCLQVKLLDPQCGILDFLQKTLDPPVFETLRNAIIIPSYQCFSIKYHKFLVFLFSFMCRISSNYCQLFQASTVASVQHSVGQTPSAIH